MNKNFFKPKFRILKIYNSKGQSTGYIVSVSYWWFPIWMTARIPLKTSDGRDTTAPAIFDKEEEAKEYIVGRYNIITVENYAKKN